MENNKGSSEGDNRIKKDVSIGVVLVLFLVGVLVFFWLLPTDSNKGPDMRSETPQVLQKGVDYYEKEQFSKALQVFENFSKENPENPLGQVWLGWGYYQVGKIQKAKNIFEGILSNPDAMTIHRGLGWVYYNLSQYNKSLQHFKKAKKEEPERAGVYKGLGQCHYKINKIDKAITNLKKTQNLGGNSPPVTYLLGNLYLMDKFYSTGDNKWAEMAKTQLKRCTDSESDVQIECQKHLALAYTELDEFNKAEELLEDIKNNQDAEILTLRGRILHQQEQRKEAAELFKKALNSSSQNRFKMIAYNGLGWTNIINGSYKDAKNYFEDGLSFAERELDNSTPLTCFPHVGLSIAEEHLNNPERAQELKKTAKKIYGDCLPLQNYEQFI